MTLVDVHEMNRITEMASLVLAGCNCVQLRNPEKPTQISTSNIFHLHGWLCI